MMTEWKWQSRDGLQMYAKRWQPDDQPKALVCIVHGFAEHVNRYNHVGEALARAGYVAQGFDVRGHGQSGGPRGCTPSYDSLLTDIQDFVLDAQKTFPTLPVFLYGHSMGGNQVLNYALRYPAGLRGVILGSPWIKLAFAPSPIQMMLARIMSVIQPSFTQHSNLDVHAISRDPAVVSAYLADRLVHNDMSAGLFTAVHNSGTIALEQAATLKVPTLLMHGTADGLTSCPTSQAFAQKAGSTVTLRLWDGFYHELHNEPEKTDVISFVIKWVGEHL